MQGEICDDGEMINSIGCKNDCSGPAAGYLCSGGSTSSPRVCTEECGDGIVTISEECDDDDVDNLDGCDQFCQVETGWSCT